MHFVRFAFVFALSNRFFSRQIEGKGRLEERGSYREQNLTDKPNELFILQWNYSAA
jgi:hypothetical protein